MKRYSAGEKFPDLTLPTYTLPERPVSRVLNGLTVFWVLRYIGCPFCQLDLVLLKSAYDRYRDLGAQVFVVMQSDREHMRPAMEDGGYPFEVVCDVQQDFYKKLGIVPAEDEKAFQGDHDSLMKKIAFVDGQGFSHGDYEGNELQLPAIFVVDEDQTILYAHYAEDVLDMPSPEEFLPILEILKK